jgi:hypothetical protein
MTETQAGLARAGTMVTQITQRALAQRAAERQGHGAGGHGDRGAAGLGAPEVRLEVLEEVAGAARARVTPLGASTARRGVVPMLARLDSLDPRLDAARALADAVERVAAPGGAKWAGLGGACGAVSDGGVTTRVADAARLRRIARRVAGIDLGHGAGIALAPRQRAGKRRPINALGAVVAVCVHQVPVAEVLRRHGYEPRCRTRRALSEALLEVLGVLAADLGVARKTS